MNHHFICRFDGLDLFPGNKTAGFSLYVTTEAMVGLARLVVDTTVQQRVVRDAKDRIKRAVLLPDSLIDDARIGFVGNTLCPRFFTTDREFGGSLGAGPDVFGHISRADAAEYLGDQVEFTPHNVDDAKTALALMLLAQTWSETAIALISSRANELEAMPRWESLPDDASLMSLAEFEAATGANSLAKTDAEAFYASPRRLSRSHSAWSDSPSPEWATHVALLRR